MHQESISKKRLRYGVRLLRTTRRLELEVREMLRKDFGCTLPRFDVMAALDRAEAPLTMSEISRQLLVSNGNVTAVVDRLVTDKLVTRKPLPRDKRTQIVTITTKGKKLFSKMAAANEALINHHFAAYDAEELDVLDALLQKNRC